MDKVLDIDEIELLLNDIYEKLKIEIIGANRTGNLSDVLKKYNLETQDCFYYEPHIAKVLVIGQTDVGISDLKRVLKKYHIPENKFEFVLDYNDAQNYPMDNLRFNQKYCDIFVGPMPHKTTGMGNCSSIIAKIKQNQSEYPKLTELKDSNGLKITKKSFENAIISSEIIKIVNNTNN